MTDVSMPTGTTYTMPPSEQLMAADDTVVIAWTLWLRAMDLRRYAMLARDRAGHGIAPEGNIASATASEAIASRLLGLAGISPDGACE